MHLLSDLMQGKYVQLKRTAEDGKEQQKLLRAGSHTRASQQITSRRKKNRDTVDAIRVILFTCVVFDLIWLMASES